jgi:hypothetical protein
MELGEPVSPPDMGVSDSHSESTCPWHNKDEAKADPMDAADPDDDAKASMPANDGGKLGKNLTKGGEDPPAQRTVDVYYGEGAAIFEAGKKSIQPYVGSTSKVTYDLQYAAHHLIPGNESLKGSELVQYLGDDDVINHFKGGQSSKIKKGKSAGYDVNNAGNGVWLPSPYALSMVNNWPGNTGISALKKRKGFDINVIRSTEDFQIAYIAASIEASGTPRQFHMRHNIYSKKVKDLLKAIATRLKAMTGSECPIAGKKSSDGKFDPPMGIMSRLNVLSANIKRFVVGSSWRDELFTDASNKKYLDDLNVLKTAGLRPPTDRVI